MGNIYNIITDRQFIILLANPVDCSIHLIFSDETNAEKLNKFRFDDFVSRTRAQSVYVNFYRRKADAALLPFYTVHDDLTRILCVASKCEKTKFDPVTGTHRLSCNFNESCTIFYGPDSNYNFFNDPSTNILNFESFNERTGRTMIGQYTIDEYNRGPILRRAMNLDPIYSPFTYDASQKVVTVSAIV